MKIKIKVGDTKFKISYGDFFKYSTVVKILLKA